MAAPEAPRDNRRLVVRILSQQILKLLRDWARDNGEDLIAVLIFTAVWTANTDHLPPRPALRYVNLHDIPPDSVRRPVSLAQIAESLCMPRAIVAVYVRDLVKLGLFEESEQGLMVPMAVLARLNTLENLNATYNRARGIVAALREAGLEVDDDLQPNPN